MRKERRGGRQLELDGDQKRMLGAFKASYEMLEGKGSGKFRGDVCCRILRAFLAKEMGPDFKVSEPNAYISGYTREFDLLILARDATPIRHTNAFAPRSVKCGIEVKANGTGYSNDPREDVRKQKKIFNRTQEKFPTIKNVYFTFQESTPTKSGAIDFWGLTREGMKPFRAFCLQNRRTQKMWPGEWGRFVKYMRSIL